MKFHELSTLFWGLVYDENLLRNTIIPFVQKNEEHVLSAQRSGNLLYQVER